MTRFFQRLFVFLFGRTEPPAPAWIPPPPPFPAIVPPPTHAPAAVVSVVSEVSDIETAPAEPPKPKREPKIAAHNPDGGQFYFKDTILDQIGFYMDVMRRFKGAHPDIYDFVSRAGVNLIPDRFVVSQSIVARLNEPYVEGQKLDPWFMQALPAHGAVCWGSVKYLLDKEEQSVTDWRAKKPGVKKPGTHPRFFYFTRFAKAGMYPTIQPAAEDDVAVYIIGAYWDYQFHHRRRSKVEKRESGVYEMAVAIRADGAITPLKVARAVPVEIRAKHKRRHQNGSAVIMRREWSYDPQIWAWGKQNDRTAEQMIVDLFIDAALLHQRLNSSMIRVAVKKGNLTAAMNVDVTRTPYFFDDRDDVVDDKGVKKRIFHIVRPHERQVGNRVTNVHMHFRGLREFVWNGYQVTITVPGRDHLNWADETFCGAVDEASRAAAEAGSEGFVGMREIGRLVARTSRPDGWAAMRRIRDSEDRFSGAIRKLDEPPEGPHPQ